MVSLEFFVEIILPAYYDPGVGSAFNRNDYQEYFLEVKATGAYDCQPNHIHAPIVQISGSLEILVPYGHIMGLYRDCVLQ